MPRLKSDPHPEFEKPELCEAVLNLLGLEWEENKDSSEGGTCTKTAWGKVYDKLIELQTKGVKFID